MKKLVQILVGVVAVAVIGLLAAASTQPDTYHVERSATYAAAPADVFPYINDYNRWNTWNPWNDIDPNVKNTYSENPVGVDAWTAWEGNKDVGKGKMTVIESVPDQMTKHSLHFIEPFEDTGTVTFTLAAEGEGTKLTWAMDGDMNLMSKVMCMFNSMDSMLGGSFEKGLETLKPKVEADAVARVEAERLAAEQASAAAAAADPAAAEATGQN